MILTVLTLIWQLAGLVSGQEMFKNVNIHEINDNESWDDEGNNTEVEHVYIAKALSALVALIQFRETNDIESRFFDYCWIKKHCAAQTDANKNSSEKCDEQNC